jgi:hypothetical protein
VASSRFYLSAQLLRPREFASIGESADRVTSVIKDTLEALAGCGQPTAANAHGIALRARRAGARALIRVPVTREPRCAPHYIKLHSARFGIERSHDTLNHSDRTNEHAPAAKGI